MLPVAVVCSDAPGFSPSPPSRVQTDQIGNIINSAAGQQVQKEAGTIDPRFSSAASGVATGVQIGQDLQKCQASVKDDKVCARFKHPHHHACSFPQYKEMFGKGPGAGEDGTLPFL
jgi:hypothetical protein